MRVGNPVLICTVSLTDLASLHAAHGTRVLRAVAIIALVLGVRPGTVILKLFPAKLLAGFVQADAILSSMLC